MNPATKMRKPPIFKAKLLYIAVAVACFLLAAAPVSAADSSSIDYTVRPGDTLWLLSQRFRTSSHAIRQENGIPHYTIYAGERLHISFPGRVHVVSRGETLFEIAQWYGTTVQNIRWVNSHYSDIIHPGQALAITAFDTNSHSDAPAAEAEAASSHQPGTAAGRLSVSDADLLARLVRAEAQGEPYEGQVAVAAVVLNRVNSSIFPNTISQVVYEPLQFEPVSNRTIYTPADETSRRAVRDAVSGWDPSHGALYFFNPAKTNNSFLWSRPHIITIGNHRFTR